MVSSLFDFGEKLELIQKSQNRIEDIVQKKIKEDTETEIINLRSEQIIISKENYPSISMSGNKSQFYQSIEIFSNSCHKSKNLYNQCLFEIRQAFFGKLNLNTRDEMEKRLRFNIRKELDKYKNLKFEGLKNKNYKNSIYKLLDKYFKDESKIRDNIWNRINENDNYSWSPQAAQQIIDMTVESWLDNDLARRDYSQHPEHRKDYTGDPGLPKYIKSSEYLSIFTNQQCKIEKKNILIEESLKEQRLRHRQSNFLTFPDHLNIKPIDLGNRRLSDKTDLREVRIIPLIKRGFYKIELVYKKVIDKIKIGNKFVNLEELNLDPNRIIGIDIGQENAVTIANNIGIEPILIKGGILLSINQWFDKIGSKLYKIYYRQQRHEKSKKVPIIMGSKMERLSFDRTNKILDILHKISRFIIGYCINNRIGTIVWGRNPGWKQKINLASLIYFEAEFMIGFVRVNSKTISRKVAIGS